MARPASPVQFKHATQQMLSVALFTATERTTRRLVALLALYDGQSRQRAAEMAQVSLRTLQRWLKLFNTRGLQGLTAVSSPGRKVCLVELDSKLQPLIASSRGRLNVAKIRRQLAQGHQIQISDTTLRRCLTRLGYRLRQAKPAEAPAEDPQSWSPAEWSKPWPPAYGESLADYLSKQARPGR